MALHLAAGDRPSDVDQCVVVVALAVGVACVDVVALQMVMETLSAVEVVAEVVDPCVEGEEAEVVSVAVMAAGKTKIRVDGLQLEKTLVVTDNNFLCQLTRTSANMIIRRTLEEKWDLVVSLVAPVVTHILDRRSETILLKNDNIGNFKTTARCISIH